MYKRIDIDGDAFRTKKYFEATRRATQFKKKIKIEKKKNSVKKVN